jgi:HK97 family phage portal protein
MKWPWQKAPEAKNQFEDVLMRIVAAQEGNLDGMVTPDTCMQSPTVHAIVTAISRRIASTPVHVYRRAIDEEGRESKERMPSHPVTRLLKEPNSWQTHHDFWADAASCFVRHGKFYAYKARGSTGPIRSLEPLHPTAVKLKQENETGTVTAEVNEAAGTFREYPMSRLFHVRGPSRNFIEGDSPVNDVKLAIALEIMAEKFGATFFQNGAMPLMIFKFMAGAGGFRTKEEEANFIRDFQDALGGSKRHRAMLLPKGVETGDPVRIENDKAQFLETRKYQRTVIAGAFGVPPHLVGDLERATFNNVEQQDQDFTLNVIMPVVQAFEASMERDLLTPADRSNGIAIRFNLDSVLRADFKSRQEGLKIQREMGVISPNEWREIEGKNPREGGDEYWQQGPSGQSANEEPENEQTEPDDPA